MDPTGIGQGEIGTSAAEMTTQGRCGRCGYSLLELARVSDAVVCPECGNWNMRPAFLNFFPWPGKGAIALRLCWPAAAVLMVMPLAVLVLPRGGVGALAVVMAGIGGLVPPITAMQLARVRVQPERQGRVVGLLAGPAVAVNLGVLMGMMAVVVRLM